MHRKVNYLRMRVQVKMAAESAAQLFARLGAKQSLGSLNLPLFSALPSSPRGGLCPGDVVEIMGGEGSGKSEMLLNITAQCILPRWWRGKEIGGKEVEVVWVSTDYKFDVVRLAAILEGSLCENGTTAELEKGNGVRRSSKPVTSQLRTATDVPVNANRGLLQSDDKEGDDYQKFISTCLSRVHVVYCNSSTELALALQSLRLNFLRQKPDVCSLVLDNVAEFYWADRAEAGSVHGAEMKQSVWVNALHSLMKEHHLVVFSAKPFLFVKMDPSHSNHQATKTKTGYKSSLRSDDVMCAQWKRMVKYCFLFTQTTNCCPSHYVAQRVLPPCDVSYNFVTLAQGIRFL